MKKLWILLCIFTVFAAGCGRSGTQVEGTLPELMENVYAGTDGDMPELVQTEVTGENAAYYLGTEDVPFTEALASEPMINAIAHSVVLLRLEDDADVQTVKETIRNYAQPDKWVCVGVDPNHVYVENRGNLVILIMDDIAPDKLLENFKAL